MTPDNMDFDKLQAEPDLTMAKLTGDWFPCKPKAYEKSVVLGGGVVLHPVSDPEKVAQILEKHIRDVARRAFQAGSKDAKARIRGVLFDA